jgi:hypothetical protein
MKPPASLRFFPNINNGDRLQPPNLNGEDNMYKFCRKSSFIAALMFLASMALSTTALQAQIVGELEAKVPFDFSVDNTRLPAGDYFIRPVQDSIDNVLEIESADNKVSVLVAPDSDQVSTMSKAYDLVFDKIGNSYFLRQIALQNSPTVYDLVQSKAEARLSKKMTKIEKRHLSVEHHKAKSSKS